MSLILVCSVLFLFLLVAAQFGGRLKAKSTLLWWLIFGFLLFATVAPGSLEPIANFFGITLVSNMVLATMSVFLALQAIQESATSTVVQRKIRDSNSYWAAKRYLDQNSSQVSSSLQCLVVHPCYNEAANLKMLIESNRRCLDSTTTAFIIINDGSTDGSEAVLQNLAPTEHVSHPTNFGVSAVLLTGFQIAKAMNIPYVVQCDADGQHPAEEIPKLVEAALTTKADLLVGSRFLDPGTNSALETTTRSRIAGIWVIRLALKLFSSKAHITDPTSGFRVYSRHAYLKLLNNIPDEYPEPESIALAMGLGLKVKEAPTRMLPRQGGQSSLSGFKSAQFMLKVLSALLGLKLRTLWHR
jgi:hypothetical protein